MGPFPDPAPKPLVKRFGWGCCWLCPKKLFAGAFAGGATVPPLPCAGRFVTPTTLRLTRPQMAPKPLIDATTAATFRRPASAREPRSGEAGVRPREMDTLLMT